MMDIHTYRTISITAASDPYEYLPELYRRHRPEIYMYDATGQLLGKCSMKELDPKYEAFLKPVIPDRDKGLKENDDAKIIIHIQAIPANVAMFILVAKEDQMNKSAKEQWYGNARCRLLDEDTFQSIEYIRLNELYEKSQKLSEGNPDPDVPEFRIALCGRIFRDDRTQSGAMSYEALHISLAGKAADIEKKMAGFSDLLKREEVGAIDKEKWDEELSQQRANVSKSKTGKGKKDDTKSGKNKSKVEEDKKNKSRSQREDEEEEKKDEESLESKLEPYMNFAFGPIKITASDPLEDIEKSIYEELEKHDKMLWDICAFGFDLMTNKKQAKYTKQIFRHCHILQEFFIRPKSPPIITPAEIAQPIEEKKEEEAKNE